MNKKTIVVNLMFYTFGVSQSWQCQSFSFKHYSHFSKRARDAIAGKKICIVCSTVSRPIVNLSKTRQTVRNPPVTIATVSTNHNKTRGWWRCWGRRFDKKNPIYVICCFCALLLQSLQKLYIVGSRRPPRMSWFCFCCCWQDMGPEAPSTKSLCLGAFRIRQVFVYGFHGNGMPE